MFKELKKNVKVKDSTNRSYKKKIPEMKNKITERFTRWAQ